MCAPSLRLTNGDLMRVHQQSSIASINGKTLKGSSAEQNAFSLLWETKKVSLGPNDTYKAFVKFRQFKRTNDITHARFSTPTRNPEIEVRMPGRNRPSV